MISQSFARASVSSPEAHSGAPGRSRAGRLQRRSLLSVLAICGLAPASVLAQHVHGVIELGVVIEGDTVAVTLNAPLSDVVGFEHAPDGDNQIERVRQAASVLASPARMFGLTDAANCTISGMSIDGPEFLDRYVAMAEDDSHDDSHDGDSDDHDHEDADHHDHDEEHDDHHDSHDDHHDHEDSDEHGHDEDEHSEVIASYEWACGDVSSLDALELRFTDGFADVETIEIQILTADDARVVSADRDTGSVSLTP